MKHWSLAFLGLFILAVAWTSYRFESNNLETRQLTPEERRQSGAGGEYLRTSAGVVHYQLAGSSEAGRTIILVHGFSVPYYLWDGTFEAFVAAGYRVLRYDLFGRGYSDRVPVEYNAELFDRQLSELLGALKIAGRVDLIGASMGGPIAAGFACKHPSQTRSLTLIGPGYSKGGDLSWKIMMPVVGEYLFATETIPKLAEGQMADFKHPERFSGWVERYRPQMRYHGFRHALLSTLRHYATSDWSAQYACAAATHVPALLMWGRDDKDVPVSLSEEFKKLMPQADLLIIEDAAHVPFLERPEVVRPAILQFLLTAGF